MALHEIPDDDTPHTPAPGCPCTPTRAARNGRWVYVHTTQAPDDDERGPGDATR